MLVPTHSAAYLEAACDGLTAVDILPRMVAKLRQTDERLLMKHTQTFLRWNMDQVCETECAGT